MAAGGAGIRGRATALDALRTVRNTARPVVERRGADYAVTAEVNCPETFEALGTVNWERDGAGHHAKGLDKARGRIGQRSIGIVQPLAVMTDYPHVRQIARVARLREVLKQKKSRRVAALARRSPAAEAF